MKKICISTILSTFIFLSSSQLTLAAKLNEVSATLTVQVGPTATSSGETGQPIKGARVIIINSLGKILSTELTDSKGIAKINVLVNKDPLFPNRQMGEVTIITVAKGYNEQIDFRVPINEFNDHTAKDSVSLWIVDPKRRNEPRYTNGSYHRLTVYDMLDDYANQVGLTKQNIKMDVGAEPPWGPDLKKQ
ncbi:hypothetical protein [Gottfriedia acidiceleris]|uniref:Carboxypeptidase regulatory-like domain-containing protein n=1 Tax=Gottfriedia acidiceleris TaxID=371036 RepID=A0ABY4JR23_9BACI|nr:hypothetical protein [Gottfriedia acidiceleris]UPM56292.1 hypothetical protein MY490_10855 [Gottfriedia acidiceleris]